MYHVISFWHLSLSYFLHFIISKVLALVALPGLCHENSNALGCLGGPAPEASSVVGRRHDVILRVNDVTFRP